MVTLRTGGTPQQAIRQSVTEAARGRRITKEDERQAQELIKILENSPRQVVGKDARGNTYQTYYSGRPPNTRGLSKEQERLALEQFEVQERKAASDALRARVLVGALSSNKPITSNLILDLAGDQSGVSQRISGEEAQRLARIAERGRRGLSTSQELRRKAIGEITEIEVAESNAGSYAGRRVRNQAPRPEDIRLSEQGRTGGRTVVPTTQPATIETQGRAEERIQYGQARPYIPPAVEEVRVSRQPSSSSELLYTPYTPQVEKKSYFQTVRDRLEKQRQAKIQKQQDRINSMGFDSPKSQEVKNIASRVEQYVSEQAGLERSGQRPGVIKLESTRPGVLTRPDARVSLPRTVKDVQTEEIRKVIEERAQGASQVVSEYTSAKGDVVRTIKNPYVEGGEIEVTFPGAAVPLPASFQEPPQVEGIITRGTGRYSDKEIKELEKSFTQQVAGELTPSTKARKFAEEAAIGAATLGGFNVGVGVFKYGARRVASSRAGQYVSETARKRLGKTLGVAGGITEAGLVGGAALYTVQEIETDPYAGAGTGVGLFGTSAGKRAEQAARSAAKKIEAAVYKPGEIRRSVVLEETGIQAGIEEAFTIKTTGKGITKRELTPKIIPGAGEYELIRGRAVSATIREPKDRLSGLLRPKITGSPVSEDVVVAYRAIDESSQGIGLSRQRQGRRVVRAGDVGAVRLGGEDDLETLYGVGKQRGRKNKGLTSQEIIQDVTGLQDVQIEGIKRFKSIGATKTPQGDKKVVSDVIFFEKKKQAEEKGFKSFRGGGKTQEFRYDIPSPSSSTQQKVATAIKAISGIPSQQREIPKRVRPTVSYFDESAYQRAFQEEFMIPGQTVQRMGFVGGINIGARRDRIRDVLDIKNRTKLDEIYGLDTKSLQRQKTFLRTMQPQMQPQQQAQILGQVQLNPPIEIPILELKSPLSQRFPPPYPPYIDIPFRPRPPTKPSIGLFPDFGRVYPEPGRPQGRKRPSALNIYTPTYVGLALGLKTQKKGKPDVDFGIGIRGILTPKLTKEQRRMMMKQKRIGGRVRRKQKGIKEQQIVRRMLYGAY